MYETVYEAVRLNCCPKTKPFENETQVAYSAILCRGVSSWVSCHSFLNRASHPVFGLSSRQNWKWSICITWYDATHLCKDRWRFVVDLADDQHVVYFERFWRQQRNVSLICGLGRCQPLFMCKLDLKTAMSTNPECRHFVSVIIHNCQNTGFVDATWSDLCRNCLWFTLNTWATLYCAPGLCWNLSPSDNWKYLIYVYCFSGVRE
jgi:hypothetical protein